ncbi:MAG: hypothetical protein NZ578_06205 [Candidatus Binatia bacterium]|nr:hypothetical protein [Candidatus Binatia bacterium]
MKKQWGYWSMMVAVVAVMATAARAHIEANLENPVPDASGVDQVSGWAFTEEGKPVTVKLRLDGVTTDVVIPCCGPRQDVVDKFGPGTPLNSSFSLLVNFGELTPGFHRIGVEISAPGEQTRVLERDVFISKPGGRVGESPRLFSFLNILDPTSAQIAVDSDTGELIVAPVRAEDRGSGETRQATLRLQWTQGTQRFVIVSAASDTSFAPVQAIFSTRCAGTGCHVGPSPAQGLDLSAGRAFRALVPVRSTQIRSRFLVNPGDAGSSYLFQKVTGENIVGARMPPVNCCLSASELDTIEDWINGGAAPPQ